MAPAMKQLLGAKYEEMQQSIEKAKVALTVGGLDQAEQLGMQIGHIISVAVTLVVAVEADAVKAAGQAARFGVAVTKEKVGVLMAGSTEKLAAQLATIEKYGFDGDVPQVPKEVDVPNGTAVVPRQGTITFETGKTLESLSVSEQQGLKAILKLGYDVHVPLEASKKGVHDIPTPEFYVDGLGKVDVYKPEQLSATTISREIGIKVTSGQANSVVVVVSEIFSKFTMYEAVARAFGKTKGGKPISLEQVIFVQGEKPFNWIE